MRFRTPEGWAAVSQPGVPESAEAQGDSLRVRIIRREGELGLDGMHVDCMLSRLADERLSHPRVVYEYDFVGGALGDRRALDSAFVVSYEPPIDGVERWRQRNVTVVGGGESICVIGFMPHRSKRDKALRRLLERVMSSVEFGPWR